MQHVCFSFGRLFWKKFTNETDGRDEHLHGFLRRENVTREWNFRRENATGRNILLNDWDQPPNARKQLRPGSLPSIILRDFPCLGTWLHSLSISCWCILHLQLSTFCRAWRVVLVAQSHLINLETRGLSPFTHLSSVGSDRSKHQNLQPINSSSLFTRLNW